MKKALIIFSLLTLIAILHACCTEQRFKSTLASLQYDGIENSNSDTVYASSAEVLLVRFKLMNSFHEISLGSFVSSCKADGGICTDRVYYDKYEDPIETLSITCNQDLQSVIANENLTSQIPGYFLFPENVSRRTTWPLILKELNEHPYHHAGGRILWLEVPAGEFLNTGYHTFTMRLITRSGLALEALSDEIYWVK